MGFNSAFKGLNSQGLASLYVNSRFYMHAELIMVMGVELQDRPV